jgi:hypothetical protein
MRVVIKWIEQSGRRKLGREIEKCSEQESR